MVCLMEQAEMVATGIKANTHLEVLAARVILDGRHHRYARVGFDPRRYHFF